MELKEYNINYPALARENNFSKHLSQIMSVSKLRVDEERSEQDKKNYCFRKL